MFAASATQRGYSRVVMGYAGCNSYAAADQKQTDQLDLMLSTRRKRDSYYMI